MAQTGDEIVLALKIEGVKNVQDLRKALADAKKEMSGLKEGTAEFNKAAAQVKKFEEAASKIPVTLKDLKKEVKSINNELLNVKKGTKEYSDLQARLSELKDNIGDLGDSARIQGTAVERLQQSFSLLIESLVAGDIDKAKVAFTGLSQAMAGIPLLALIALLGLLVQNFDKVIEISKVLFNAFTEEELALRRLNLTYEKQTILNKQIQTDLQNEITLLKAKQAPLEKILDVQNKLFDIQLKQLKLDLEKEKATLRLQKSEKDYGAILQVVLGVAINNANLQNKVLEERINKFVETEAKIAEIENKITETQTAKEANRVETEREIQEKAEEARRKLNEARIANIEEEKAREIAAERERFRQQQVDNKGNYALLEEYEKTYRDNVSKIIADFETKKQAEEEKQAQEEAARRQAETDAAVKQAQEEIKLAQDRENEIRKAEDERFKAGLKANREAYEQRLKDAEEAAAKEKAIENAKFSTFRFGLQASQDLVDAFYLFQVNKAEGNAERENELRKQAFELDKAFSIAKATTDGYKAVLSTYADTPGGPILKGIAAGIAGVFAVAQIAKIAANQFKPTASADTSSIKPDTSSSLSPGPPPSTRVTSPVGGSTLLNSQGKPITQAEREEEVIRAYVLSEQQFSGKQKTRKRAEEQSKF